MRSAARLGLLTRITDERIRLVDRRAAGVARAWPRDSRRTTPSRDNADRSVTINAKNYPENRPTGHCG